MPGRRESANQMGRAGRRRRLASLLSGDLDESRPAEPQDRDVRAGGPGPCAVLGLRFKSRTHALDRVAIGEGPIGGGGLLVAPAFQSVGGRSRAPVGEMVLALFPDGEPGADALESSRALPCLVDPSEVGYPPPLSTSVQCGATPPTGRGMAVDCDGEAYLAQQAPPFACRTLRAQQYPALPSPGCPRTFAREHSSRSGRRRHDIWRIISTGQ